MYKYDVVVDYKPTGVLERFENPDEIAINACVDSTYVYLTNAIDEGFSTGNKVVDSLISMKGSHLRELGVREDHTLYKIHCRSGNPKDKIQVAKFMQCTII